MVTPLEDLSSRVSKLEKQKDQEALALIEILSNATFFGELKKSKCQYAVKGQCGLFILKNYIKNKIPIVTECRISQCEESTKHYHIELSNITCTLCEKTNPQIQRNSSPKKTHTQRRKTKLFKEPKEE